MLSLSVTIQLHTTELYFPVVLFTMLLKVVLAFESGNESLKSDHRSVKHWSVECFHSRVQHLCKFIEQKEAFAKEKSSTPRGLVWDTNMATVSLFRNTNMADVTSCENTLYFPFIGLSWVNDAENPFKVWDKVKKDP